jgi:hypothetical protein
MKYYTITLKKILIDLDDHKDFRNVLMTLVTEGGMYVGDFDRDPTDPSLYYFTLIAEHEHQLVSFLKDEEYPESLKDTIDVLEVTIQE